MKPNDDFHRSSHPSDTDQQQTSSSQDESRRRVCLYCVNSENSESSANSSPSITPFKAANVNRDSQLSSFDFKLNDASQSAYPKDLISRPPSSLKPTANERPSQKPSKVTTTQIAGSSGLKNSSRSAVAQSTASQPNESHKSSYGTSLSQTVAPAVGKLCSRNSTRSTGTKASSVAQSSKSARTDNSVSYSQTISIGKTNATKESNFHVRQTGSNRQHAISRRPNGLQSLTNDPVGTYRQTTNDRPNPQAFSTSLKPSASDRAGTHPNTTTSRVDTASTAGARFGSSQPPSTEPLTTNGLETTDQPRTKQPYTTVETQRTDSKSTTLPSQSTSRPDFNSKSASQPSEVTRSTTENVEKSKPSVLKTDTTKAPVDTETLTTAASKAPSTKVEFSKLQTGSPGMTNSNDEDATKRLPPTTKDTGASYQTTTKRPMQRCHDSTQSGSTCTPDDELRTSTTQATDRPQDLVDFKSMVPYASQPALFTIRRTRPAFLAPKTAAYSTAQSAAQPAQRSSRFSFNRPTSLSIEDVGVDGSRAYIIRQEQRGKVDWRRKPRFKVKQTTTSRLRYGYWFANCGRERVKAFRGDWSQIPEEMLRNWEVYQNYFRYRLKGKRKRTSSLVRKFIAGKYRQKRTPPVYHRPIRRMSPLLPSKPSPFSRETADSGADASDEESGIATKNILEVDFNVPPPVRGSNVRDLLVRRERLRRRQKETAQQRQAQHGRSAEAYRKPQIEVHSTFTSRLRKSSTLQPCSKPVTPTLWHGSAGEMEDLKQKIALRRQRLKSNWLKQTSELMKGAEAEEQDARTIRLMAHLMVVGAPLTKRLSVVSSQCENFAPKDARARAGVAKTVAYVGGKKKNGSTANARAAQHLVGPQLPVIPETDWFASSSQKDASSSAVAAVPNFCRPAASSMPPAPCPNRVAKKKKSFVARKLLSIARWIIPPAIPKQQNLTSTKCRQAA